MLIKRLVNLCPHDINVYDSSHSTIRIVYKSLGCARVESKFAEGGNALGVPIKRVTKQEVTGLPEPVEGTLYIVSRIVLSVLNGSRPDCVSPNTITDRVTEEESKTTIGVVSFITDCDVNFEASTLTAFMRIYRNAFIFKRKLSLSDINPLYLYYKAIVQAGGSWPTVEELNCWRIVTIDEVADILVEKERMQKEGYVFAQNRQTEGYIYSHAEIVLTSGKYYIVKDFII